jgi:hypothetical protein
MGERTTNRQMLKLKAETLTEPEIKEVLDELLNLLADALENRRARMVSEWERVRRKADHRASYFTAGGRGL